MKKKLGISLIELVIAIAIFMVVSVPIYAVYEMTVRQSRLAHRLNTATITARLQLEELMGRTWQSNPIQPMDLINGPGGGFTSDGGWINIGWGMPRHQNGFIISVTKDPNFDITQSPLLHVVINVHENIEDYTRNNVFVSIESIINVARRGILF
ncbi:MAG: prepilin-type N-terminal cleavage/methylation domain-containing protein [Defluviitaleaceae bacterium]|nr:prepilin-type N-terminal cleavage/methylation domain-containing protein [Defluviitaleaceae bacterium]